MTTIAATLTTIPAGIDGTVETLKAMARLVDRYKTAPAIVILSRQLIQHLPQKDQYLEALTLFNWVRDNIRYVRDVNGVETLSTPIQTLKMMCGDCDDQTTLLVCMLESIGIKNRFVVVGHFGQFYHVLSECFVNGGWVACDPCENVQFGQVFKKLPDKAVYTL